MRKNTKNYEKLSSPSLVDQNSNHNEESIKRVGVKEERIKSPKSEVLRVPKKSEMAYFGVQVSPKPTKKLISKPDLLQFNDKSSLHKENKVYKEPTYENVEVLKKEYKSNKREFDSSILEELTKAADQIMQAVNGYADDDRNKSATDDEKYRKEPLDTISETKSWQRETDSSYKKVTTQNEAIKSKLKSSSNSSIESFTRECRKASTPIKKTDKSSYEKHIRKKPDTSNVKALTKARRLQRASSREALLQCHGSSSEDLPANDLVQLRKPRLVKRTKTQLTVSNGLEMHKKSEKSVNNKKPEEVITKKDDR